MFEMDVDGGKQNVSAICDELITMESCSSDWQLISDL